jgi:hypothetical protein
MPFELVGRSLHNANRVGHLRSSDHRQALTRSMSGSVHLRKHAYRKSGVARRIEAQEQRLADLRARRKMLEEANASRPEVPTALVVRETAEAIARAMTRGNLQQRKALPSAARRRRRAQQPGRDGRYVPDPPDPGSRSGSGGGRPGTRTRMGFPTRPSNVRVYQFRQPPRLGARRQSRHLPARGLEPLTSWSEAMRSIH